MGNVVGSFTGTLAGSCVAGIVQAGDFSDSHWAVKAGLDSALVLAPIALWMLGLAGESKLLFGVIYALMTMFMFLLPIRYYGAKLVVPVLMSVGIFLLYQSILKECIDLSFLTEPESWVYLASVGAVGVMSAVVVSDFGVRATVWLRSQIAQLGHLPRWQIVCKIIIANLCIIAVLYVIWGMGLDWIENVLILGITILSLVELGLSGNPPPRSIVSVAATVACLATVPSTNPIGVLVGLVLYNNFVLVPVKKEHTLLPQYEGQSSEFAYDIMIGNALLALGALCVMVPDTIGKNGIVFSYVFLAVSLWIVIAPYVFPNRVFS
jgi:hypothetical protein